MLVNTRTLAERLGLQAKTLLNWRVSGRGPVYRKLGGRVMYDLDDVQRWIDASKRTSTSDNNGQVAA